jgi:rhodanese-related sulfurtransferase
VDQRRSDHPGNGASLEGLLAAAEARVRRYAPGEVRREAVLVDIRARDARERDGVIPGALHVPRTVLEWRVAPGSAWRTPHLDGSEPLVLVCDHGYSSLLAAATLVDLGLDAGDVLGGFAAWASAGLPVKQAPPPPPGLPGTGPPD